MTMMKPAAPEALPALTSSIDASDAQAIEAAIDSDELTALVLELCNIPAPVGREEKAGQFVYDWLREEGFVPRKVGLVENRFNVVGRYGGRGAGPNVLVTAHLGTHSPMYCVTCR